MAAKGAKGSKNCCCSPCEVRPGCRDGGHKENFCCACVPATVCVNLNEDGDPYTTLAIIRSEWECSVEEDGYSGTLTCGDDSIDFVISLEKDEYTQECSICLTSEALGHTGENRVCLPMSADSSTKREECRTMEFSFPVDLSSLTCTESATGTINIAPSDYLTSTSEPTCGPGSNPPECLCEMACITYTDVDEYGEAIEEKATVCMETDYDGTKYWEADLGLVSVRIEVETENPLTFRLIPAGVPAPADPVKDVCCFDDADPEPFGCRMNARWDTWETASQAVIRVSGEGNNYCADCECFCRCLCITYADINGSTTVVSCRDEYTGIWGATFGDLQVTLSLECVGCLIPITMMRLEANCEIINTNPRSIVCPDGIDNEWSLECEPGETGLLTVTCVGCGDDCDTTFQTDCCYEPLPANLTATIEDQSGNCANLDGLEIPLVLHRPSGRWNGKKTVQVGGQDCIIELIFTCGNEGKFELTIVGSGTSKVVPISCDPFEALFCAQPPGLPTFTSGCCDTPVSSDLCIRVTL